LDLSPFDASYTGKKGFKGIEVFNQIDEWEHPKDTSPSPGLGAQLSVSPTPGTKEVALHLDLSHPLNHSLLAGTAQLSEIPESSPSPTLMGNKAHQVAKNEATNVRSSSPEPSSPGKAKAPEAERSVVFNVNSAESRSNLASRRAQGRAGQDDEDTLEEDVCYESQM
jgi:hypothetical protein